MNMHEQEERDFGRGPLLWDADPDVCCAAFQLGACVHTEARSAEEAAEDDARWLEETTRLAAQGHIGAQEALADRFDPGWDLPVGGHVDLGDEEPF